MRRVLALEEPYRETVLLRFFEDLPLKAIADRMRAPLETVRTRLRRGLAMLRSELEAKESKAWPVALLPLLGAPGAKAATAAGIGVLLMSKTKAIALVAIAIALSIGVWLAASGRLWPETPKPDQTDTSLQPPPADLRAAEKPAQTPANDSAAAQIRPKPFVDEETGAAGTRRGAASEATPDGAAIEGEVLSPDGEAVEGATVLAGDADKEGTLRDEESIRLNLENHLDARGRILKTTSAADGKFRFDRVPPAVRLSVAAAHPELGVVAAVGIPVKAGERRTVQLRFEAGLRVFGRVTDRAMNPIKGAKVQPSGFKGPQQMGVQSNPVTTDDDGNYRTSSLPGGLFHVSATASGYYRGAQRVKDITPGERERRVDFVLETASVLRGKLVLADGSPARVSEHLKALFGKNLEAGVEPGFARGGVGDQHPALVASSDDPRSDPNFRSVGRMEGKVLEAEDRYELVPEWKGVKFLSLWLGRELLGVAEQSAQDVAPDIVVDWSKARPPKGRGTVTLIVKSAADRAPVTHYWVDIAGPVGAPLLDRGGSGHRVKAADGRYRFEPLVEAQYELSIKADGFADKKLTVDVVPDPASNEVVVELVPESQSPAKAWVAGVVRDASGAAVNGATVWLVPEKAERARDVRRAPTNAEGAFRFDKLLPDSYIVIAESRGQAPAWTRAVAQPSADGLTLTLPPGVAVGVTHEGAPGPIILRVIEPDSGIALIDDVRHGQERFGDTLQVFLAPGRYRLEVMSPNFETARSEFTAAAGLTVRLAMTRSVK